MPSIKPIKLHAPLIQSIEASLHTIFNDGIYADKEVLRVLKQQRGWGSRDRSFYAETIYDIVRNKRKYEHQAIKYSAAHQEKSFKAILLISLLSRKNALQNPELLGFSEDETIQLLNKLHLPLNNHAIESSYPQALYNYCQNALSDNWESIADSLNLQAKIYLRLNTLKTTKQKFANLLKKENIPFAEVDKDLFLNYSLSEAIEIIAKNNLKQSAHYKEGLFEFQDIGSQLISLFAVKGINDFTKLSVLDLCAGAGGKTLHLSALMKNKGKISATDFHSERLTQLEKRRTHAGCKNIDIVEYQTLQKSTAIFDLILIDAPCSGLGTLKRNPDLKWKLSVETIENLIKTQTQILEKASKMLAPNGQLIYATCSILPQENEYQIFHFLERHTNFRMCDEQKINPATYPCDGFYMARLQKSN